MTDVIRRPHVGAIDEYFGIKRNGLSRRSASFYQFGAREVRSESSAKLEYSVDPNSESAGIESLL